MWQRLRETWFSGLLFLGTLFVAAVLVLLVVLAPLQVARTDEAASSAADRTRRVLFVFAHDKTVRRTAVASALGLTVTAFVFFRPGVMRGKKAGSRRPPPTTLAGA